MSSSNIEYRVQNAVSIGLARMAVGFYEQLTTDFDGIKDGKLCVCVGGWGKAEA